MEGHFLVCENAEEEFDISFQVNSTMDSVIPKDQQELYVKAESACNIIKALENTDKQTKKKYFDKLLSLSQVGLVANPAQTETAEFALMKLKDEIVLVEGKGYAGLVVYADDFVVTFQYKSDAEWFYEHLKHRMEYFGLSLEEEKSRLIEFGRYAKARCQKLGKKPETFTFLGFTHYCSQSRNGRFRVKRKTSKKKFAKKCREINLLLARMRTHSLKEIITKLNQILTGYYHYYGITDNSKSITAFRYNIMKSLFYCLNRRSQKKSYNWIRFLNMMNNSYPLVRPRIYVSVYE